MNTEYLIEPLELFRIQNSDNLIIIDTREPEEYNISHIPDSFSVYDIFSYLSTQESGGYVALQKHFQEIFSGIGISKDKLVVIYEDALDNGYGRSCRGLFILNYLGHKNVRILNGGFQNWILNGLPTSDVIPIAKPCFFNIDIDSSIIVDYTQVFEAVSNEKISIVDCRDHSEWVGVSSSPYGPDFCPRKGRIPTAVWFEWYNTMRFENWLPQFKKPDEIVSIFNKIGLSQDSDIIVYCFKGARTSNVFIALKMAGFNNVRNYLGSWNEWSRNSDLPIETGYPRLRRF